MSILNNTVFPVLQFFRIFGLCPTYHQRTSPRAEFRINILHMLNIFLELVLLYICYVYARSMFDFSHTINLIVDTLQIVAAMFTHLVCLLECVYEKHRLRRIWTMIMGLVESGGERLRPFLVRRLVRYICVLITSFLICTSIEIWIMCNAAPVWFRSRAVGQWSFMSCRAAFLFYVLHVELLGCVLQMISQELKYVASTSRNQLKSLWLDMNRKETRKRIIFCKECYSQVYEVSLEMSLSFGWSLICHLMYNFIDITIAIYYNYRRIVLKVLTPGEIYKLYYSYIK